MDKIASDDDLFAKKVKAKEIFGSHLLLGEKTVRASAPKILNSLAFPPKNPWSALCAVRLYPPKKPLSSLLVPEEGLEPSRLAAYDFESYVYTNFTTPAH